MELYCKAFSRGDAEAAAQLCEMYEAGEGVPASSAQAMELYNQLLKLADNGNVRAEFAVGYFNLTGIAKKGDQADPDIPPPTGDQGVEPPIVNVGDQAIVTIKVTGGIENDIDYDLPAVPGLEVVSKQRSVSITYPTGTFSRLFSVLATHPGTFVIPAFDIALPDGTIKHEHEMKLVVRGDVPELEANPDAAFDWLTKSATEGDGEAAFDLALAYKRPGRTGVSLQMGEVYATDWLRHSADDGFPPAEAMLGEDYANGTGMAVDCAKALYWNQKAADQGNVNGEAGLGVLYALGHGTPPNAKEAIKWEQKAIAGGNVEAKYLLGRMYDDGTAGISDHVLAVRWYTEAANAGNVHAKKALIGPSLSHTWTKDEWRAHVRANNIHPNEASGIAGSICTRDALYEAVGMPDHTQTIDGSKLLYWICSDGQIQLVCNEQPFANGEIIGRINDF